MYRHMICILIYVNIGMSVMEHGEFGVMVTKYETCKGPKRNNCTESMAKIEDNVFLALEINVTEDVTTRIKGKITGMLKDKELLRLQIKNVCDHIFFKPLFQSMFDQGDRCGVFKGQYRFRMNVAELSQKFYGGKFIYGNWSFIGIFYTDLCNFSCSRVDLTMKPKSSS